LPGIGTNIDHDTDAGTVKDQLSPSERVGLRPVLDEFPTQAAQQAFQPFPLRPHGAKY
jgi:hypothetical protein